MCLGLLIFLYPFLLTGATTVAATKRKKIFCTALFIQFVHCSLAVLHNKGNGNGENLSIEVLLNQEKYSKGIFLTAVVPPQTIIQR